MKATSTFSAMLRRAAGAVLPAAFGLALLGAAPAAAAEGGSMPPRQDWSFAGFTGKYDKGQLQRGFKVYREVCASCHGLSLVAFRNLAEPGGPGFSTGQVQALAAEYKVQDGPDDSGEMFERPGRPADRFPSPFPNEEAARAANGGAYPPDMSLLAKARSYSRGFPWFLIDSLPGFAYQEHGVDYIHAILVGYHEAPADMVLQPGQYYNEYMPGHRIAMAKPIEDGQVEYTDGTPATVDQYGKDVAAFMMWAAEPKLEARKKMGLSVMLFLLVFAGLLYATKKKVWSGLHQTPTPQA